MTYDEQLEQAEKTNQVYLDEFKEYLLSMGDEYVEDRVDDMDLYLNHYINYEDWTSAEEGVFKPGMFFGWFLIRKVMGIGLAEAYRMSRSWKLFYGMMAGRGRVKKEDYEYMCEGIDENMERWLFEMQAWLYGSDEEDDGLSDDELLW